MKKIKLQAGRFAALLGMMLIGLKAGLFGQALPPVDRNVPAGLSTATLALG